ncbi:MAG: HAMP domain-containing histidine kinase [Chloroflexi bacterium]|nr:HAMP domain-containing histidine kinase [Chloroflexota bacterium]
MPLIPQGVIVGFALIAAGVVLDLIWPQQLFFVSIGTGFGPVLTAIGAIVMACVLGPALLRRDATQWRAIAHEARERATVWEQRARAQENAHRRFMRELDHELKNPLQAMKAALAELSESDAGNVAINTARAQTDRLRSLVAALRQVANIAPDRLALEPVDLDELVRDAVELTRATDPQGRTRVRISAQRIPWRPAPVMVDRELVSFAVYNLLDNALKYSPGDRVVEVRLYEDGAHATIEVADAGLGIEQVDLPHVTEELFRAARTDGIDGSGLGLALVNRVAEAHDGQLKIRSRAEEGTSVALQLPLA